ncbi:hypothetical protein KNP414_07869 [Paenibacillus mucilaginosus KNP414]|uniref:Uncharacterized protein n=1 Tax=Paenibacillus mucilaginosus (strain KNP414) TaxID=1036673 RepID=F8FIX6_PAEMK|nr:hypothetical protein KNP414_07869 [Paenibacillus mucilaginosus KNP414]
MPRLIYFGHEGSGGDGSPQPVIVRNLGFTIAPIPPSRLQKKLILGGK